MFHVEQNDALQPDLSQLAADPAMKTLVALARAYHDWSAWFGADTRPLRMRERQRT